MTTAAARATMANDLEDAGLGAAAPPSQDPRWKHVGHEDVKNLLAQPSFNQALRGGNVQKNPIGEWRTFSFHGSWYGRRMSPRGTFFFVAPMTVGAPPPADVHRASPDMQKWAQVASPPPAGQLTPTSPHANKWAPGAHGPPPGWTPDLHRWGGVPRLQPNDDNPNWRMLSHAEMMRLQKTAGWADAVNNAAKQRRGVWQFHNVWYKHGANLQFYVLGTGSGGTTTRSFAGVPGLGQEVTNATGTRIPDEVAAAQAMTDALNAHGYRKADMPIYGAFQLTQGLKEDDFPGTATMTALFAVDDANGIPRPNVTVYPWLAGPGYDGVNAPLLSQWDPGVSPAVPPTVVVKPNVNVTVQSSKALPWLVGAGVFGIGLIGWGVWRKSQKKAFIPSFA